jgi:hypothetical protein
MKGDTATQQQTTRHVSTSKRIWEGLEAVVREHMQRLIQALIAAEVTAVLGRPKSSRRTAVDAPPGYRNGWPKPNKDTVGEVTLIVLHALTPQARQKLTGVFWPEASPPTML